MADIGQTDLSFKPDVNIAAIASLAQKKAEMEQQQAFQGQQMQTMATNRTLDTIKMATDLTQSLIKMSGESSMRQGQQHLQEILGQSNQPISSEVPQATMSQTPQYQGQLKAAALQANPAAYTEALSKNLNIDPQTALLAKQNKLLDIQLKTANVGEKQKLSQPISATVKQAAAKEGVNLPDDMTLADFKAASPLMSAGLRAAVMGDLVKTREAAVQLGSVQGGPGALEQGKIQQARHLDQLIYQTYDKGSGTFNIKPFQYTEMALGLARLVSPQSVVAQNLENKIEQPTTKGDLAKLYVRITGDTSTDLSNASTQDIVKLYAHAIQRQGETAEDNRNDAYNQAQSALGKKLDTSSLMSYRKYHDKVQKLAGYNEEPTGSGMSLPSINDIDAELARRK